MDLRMRQRGDPRHVVYVHPAQASRASVELTSVLFVKAFQWDYLVGAGGLTRGSVISSR
jgi:hypothetical protein